MTDRPRPDPTAPRYRPVSARRRLLILLFAIATAITGVLTLIYPPGGVKRVRPLPAPCRDGRLTGCVGGQADVILLSPAASAAR